MYRHWLQSLARHRHVPCRFVCAPPHTCVPVPLAASWWRSSTSRCTTRGRGTNLPRSSSPCTPTLGPSGAVHRACHKAPHGVSRMLRWQVRGRGAGVEEGPRERVLGLLRVVSVCWWGQVGVFAGGEDLVFCVHGKQLPACCITPHVFASFESFTHSLCVLVSILLFSCSPVSELACVRLCPRGRAAGIQHSE